MDSATTSPKKVQKKRTEKYSMCFLYNTGEALAKLTGLTMAKCNPTLEKGRQLEVTKDENEIQSKVMEIIIVCLTTGKTISFNTFFSIKCYLEGV